MISYVECLGGEGAGPNAGSRCWTGDTSCRAPTSSRRRPRERESPSPPTSTLSSPQRLMGNPTSNLHLFRCRAPRPPPRPAPATPGRPRLLAAPRPPSGNRRYRRSTATGPAGGAGPASSAPDRRPRRPRPFSREVLIGSCVSCS